MHASLDPLDVDVVVAGAGLRGAMLAQRLASAGVRVALFEANDVGEGSSKRRLVFDPGISGEFDPDRAGALRALLAELASVAPRLCQPVRAHAATDGGWARRRALAALSAHDRVHPATAPASAEMAEGDAISLTAYALEEARLALAYVLDARRRGAVVRTETRVTSLERGDGITLRASSALGTSTVTARAVVLAVGAGLAQLMPDLASASPPLHGLELILARSTSVARRSRGVEGTTIEQVRFGAHTLLRAWGPQPPDLDALLATFEGPDASAPEVLDVRRASWTAGPCALTETSLPEVLAITGSRLSEWSAVLADLLQRLAPREPARTETIEDPDFEITAAIERTRLGAPLLAVLSARHGGRGARIAERVMAVPREGAIVCPCSTVTEAEIRFAHREELASDLSAICRRTELGLGACAGLRCGLRAAQVLASETLASPSDEALGGRVASLQRAFLSERRAASVLEPERRAILDELARGMRVATGAPLEEAE